MAKLSDMREVMSECPCHCLAEFHMPKLRRAPWPARGYVNARKNALHAGSYVARIGRLGKKIRHIKIPVLFKHVASPFPVIILCFSSSLLSNLVPSLVEEA